MIAFQEINPLALQSEACQMGTSSGLQGAQISLKSRSDG
jgi:hypothetical protein